MSTLALEYSIELMLDLIQITVACWISIQLFKNLYRRKHNWIMEPSVMANKAGIISVVFTSISGTINLIWDINGIIYFTEFRVLEWILIIPDTSFAWYFLFVLYTLKNQMNKNDIFAEVIPHNFVRFLQAITWLTLFTRISEEICLRLIRLNVIKTIEFDECQIIYYLIRITFNLFLDISFVYLYFIGLRNVAKYWWYSTAAQESANAYDDDCKIHEILLVITRCTVICCISITVDVIYIICQLSFNYEWDPTPYGQDAGTVITYFLWVFMLAIDHLAYAMAIYFIYDFGHSHYLKLCGYCHNKMYGCCKTIHMKELKRENGFKKQKTANIDYNNKYELLSDSEQDAEL